jgi:amino acid transporter
MLSADSEQVLSSVWIQRCFSLLALWAVIGLNSLGTRWGLLVNYVCTILKLIGVISVSLMGIVFIGTLTPWRSKC